MLCFLAFPTFLFLFDVAFLLIKKINGFFISVQVHGNQWFWSGFFLFFDFFNSILNSFSYDNILPFDNSNNNNNKPESEKVLPIFSAIAGSPDGFSNGGNGRLSPQQFVKTNPSLFPELALEEAYAQSIVENNNVDVCTLVRFNCLRLFTDFLDLHTFHNVNTYAFLRFFYAHSVYIFGIVFNSGDF